MLTESIGDLSLSLSLSLSVSQNTVQFIILHIISGSYTRGKRTTTAIVNLLSLWKWSTAVFPWKLFCLALGAWRLVFLGVLLKGVQDQFCWAIICMFFLIQWCVWVCVCVVWVRLCDAECVTSLLKYVIENKLAFQSFNECKTYNDIIFIQSLSNRFHFETSI